MNIAKWALRQWLPMYEASHYLTSKLNCGPYGSENAISGRDVLDLALAGRVPLTLNIPPSMKDKQGRELEDGLWDLLMKRERGKPGRRQVKHQLNQSVSVKGIDGAWVARKSAGKRVVRQLRPKARPGDFPSAFPEGCALGVRTKALNDCAKKLKGQTPPKSADALDKPLKERERTTLLAIIAAMAAEAKIDLSHPTTAASSVVERLQLMGIRLGQTTVEGHLKKAIEASEKLKK